MSPAVQLTAPLFWIDLEMSGLDPERERILELACLITDSELNILAEGPEFVLHQDEKLLAQMDEWNQKHHAESGLIDRVRKSKTKEAEVEAQLLEFLGRHVSNRESPVAGNSVHQDRRFLSRYLPRVDEYLHYRNVDVSTIKELCRRWYPKVYEDAPAKRQAHRALEDIYESIAELRYYRDHIFK